MAIELLPIDIVDLILSFLHSDMDALTTCAQSHLSLSKLSKRYIYANITLRDDLYHIKSTNLPEDQPIDLRTSKFAQILATKSDIANHVRSLTVTWVKGDPGSEQHNATSSHLDRVASLLPMLVGLTAFTFTGSLSPNDCLTWHSIPETFRQAFLHLLGPQLVMKNIVISHIAFFPMSLLNNCKNTRITLRFCEDTQYDKESTNPEEVLRSSPVPFEHLSIRYCSEMCPRNIAPWVTMHGLHSLEYADYSGNSLPQFLVGCSNSLKNLYLEIENIYTAFYYTPATYASGELIHFPFTLASLRQLIQLTINTNSTFLHFFHQSDAEGIWFFHSPIPAIVELISTAWPTLKKISIKVMFCFGVPDFERQQLPDPVVVWDAFIPLAAKCSSASISMHISPSLQCDIHSYGGGILHHDIKAPAEFSPLFADFKGLTPYVQNGVVTISEEYLNG